MIKDNPEDDGYEFVSRTIASENSGHMVIDLLVVIYNRYKNDLFEIKFADFYIVEIDENHHNGISYYISVILNNKVIVDYYVKQEHCNVETYYYNNLYKKTHDEVEENKFLFYAKLLK